MSENPGTSVRPSPGPGRSSFRPGSRTGAAEERMIPKPTMDGMKKSDEAVVPMKAANKGAQTPAESPEGRASTKGNSRDQSTYRTQGRLIAEDARPGSDVMLARDPISHAPLQARHEGHAPRLQLMEPLEVKIRAVRHDHAAGWKRPGAGDLDVAGLALGHTDEARQMARLIQPDVQLDRKPSCVEKTPTGRPPNTKAMVVASTAYNLFLNRNVPRRALPAAAQQASKQRLVEGVRLLGIDARQRRATDRRPYAQVDRA